MENFSRNLILVSIILILTSMFGGDLLGSWFYSETEVKDSGFLLVEESINFMLEEVEGKNNCDAPKSQETCIEFYGDIKNTADFQYDSGDTEAMEDVMGQIRGLLYLCFLAIGVILYFINEDKKDNAAIACLLLSGMCILIVLIFVITFPLALDEDTESFSAFDESPSIYGNVVEEYPNNKVTVHFKWRLGVAPLLILLSGVIALISFYDLKVKNSGEINTSPIIVNAYEINTDTNNDRVLVDGDEKIENAPQKTNKKEVSSLADELKKLSDLKEQGILDEEEFKTAKRKLMENL